MDERLVGLVKTFLPDAEVLKIYKEGEDIKVDVNMGGTAMTCSIKKNHAGELYLD